METKSELLAAAEALEAIWGESSSEEKAESSEAQPQAFYVFS